MKGLFNELKRRNIFRVGVAYLVLAWLILQVGAIVAPALKLPEWTLTFIIFILVIGLPLVLFFAWAFEMTPQGLKRTEEVNLTESVTAETGKKLNRIIISVLCLAVVALLAERFLVGGSATPAPTVTAGVSGGPYESIAVLPFVNMSDDTAQEYFSDGISEELLNLLAKQRGLRVAARTSSFAYKDHNKDIKEIGQALDVETVLEGSVRKSGPKIRITAQLIEADTGYHLWSNTYDRELNDIFAIQDEISEAIVGALQVHLNGEGDEPVSKSKVTNLDAYNAYLKGQHNLQKREKTALYEALGNFDLAITYDPTYAPAYSGKADAYMLLGDGGASYGDIPTEQTLALAAPIIERGLELDPESAELYASKGLLLQSKGEPEEAIAVLTHAIELAPNLSRAYLWRGLAHGDLKERNKEIEDFEKAILLDPLSLPPKTNLLRRYVDKGEIAKAEMLFEEIKEITGDKIDRFVMGEVYILWSKGELAAAYNRAKEIYEANSDFYFPLVFSYWRLGDVEGSVEYINESNKFLQFRAKVLLGQLDEADKMRTQFLQSENLPPLAKAFSAANLAYHYKDPEKFAALAAEFEGVDLSRASPIFDNDPDDLEASTIATVLFRAGRMDELQELLKSTRAYIAEYKAKGYEGDLLTEELVLELYSGNKAKAMELLRSGVEQNEVTIGFFNSAELELFENSPEYVELRQQVFEKVNKERAKLGWEPLEVPAN